MKITTTKIIVSTSALLFVLVLALITLSNSQHKAINQLVEQHKKELESQSIKYSKSIDSLQKVIHNKQEIVDYLMINGKELEDKIIANDVATGKKKEDTKKLTKDEKVTWLLNRYSTSNK